MSNFEKKYWARARLAAGILQFVPFIKMIGLNGSLAQGKATPKSDIDLLIVTTPRRIWTGRFLAIILISLCGIKTKKNKTAGRICLNRFITDESLAIFPYDKYHAKNFSSLIPIYDCGIYQKYIIANIWMTNFTPTIGLPPRLIKSSKIILALKSIFEKILLTKIGDSLEFLFKKYQLQIIKKNASLNKNSGLIIATDEMICYHPQSQFFLTKLG